MTTLAKGRTVVLCLAMIVFAPNYSRAAAGSRDATFTTPTGGDTYPSSMRIGPDGKITVGGQFQNYAGLGLKSVARLTADGAVDTTFNPGAGALVNTIQGNVTDIEIQTDGKAICVGSFNKFGGLDRNSIVRLNVDGSVDAGFNPTLVGSTKDAAIQSDGKILICGATSVNGVTQTWKVYRLNVDGSVDQSFVGPTLGGSVSPIQIKALASGKIEVAATYLTDTATVFQVVRLNSNGTIDPTFTLGKGGEGSPTGATTRIEEAPDGKLVIAGIFSKYNGVTAPHLARLNLDGSVDGTFNVSGITISTVANFAVQPDGKILFAGSCNLSGVSLFRFESSGLYDAAYKPQLGQDATASVYQVTLQGNKPLASAQIIQFVPTIAFIPGVYRLTADEAGPPTITTQPIAQTVTAGGTAQFKVTPGGTGPFTYQWKKGGVDIPGATADTYTIDAASTDDAVNFSVVVSNASGSTLSADVSLTVLAATPGKIFRDSLAVPGANAEVKAIVRAPDGKVFVSGMFGTFTGTNRNEIARLFSNGQLDPGFVPPTTLTLTIPYTLGALSDGRVIVGGNVSADYNNISHFGMLRFLTTGGIDNTFNSNGIGTDDTPFAILIQSDDKIVTGGFAAVYNSASLGHIFRVTAAGAADTTFNPAGAGAGPGIGGYLYDLSARADGKFYGAGAFLTYNGNSRSGVVLLNADGTLDNSFVPALPAGSTVKSCAAQSDGKVLVGGSFNVAGPASLPVWVGVVRLTASGSMDPTFTPLPLEGTLREVWDIALQKDGKIVIGGFFTSIGGVGIQHLARLKTNGSLDTSFDPGAGPNGAVNTICVTAEDTLWIGGQFTQYDGFPRQYIARLNIGAYETPGQQLTFTMAAGALNFDWPAASFSLQYTDTLNPPNWTTLPDAPPFTVRTSSGIRFYRLMSK